MLPISITKQFLNQTNKQLLLSTSYLLGKLPQQSTNQSNIISNSITKQYHTTNPPIPLTKENVSKLVPKSIDKLGISPTLKMNMKMKWMEEEGKKKVIKFGFGQSPFPVLPSVASSLQSHAHQKDYLPVRGLPELQEAIQQLIKHEKEIDYPSQNIFIGPGSKQLLFQLMQSLDCDVLLPSPSWVSYAPQATIAGKRVRIVKTKKKNNWHVTAADIIETLKKKTTNRVSLLIINDPNNPSGQSMESKEQMEELATVLRANNVILLADEIYSRLTFSGHHSSMANYYPEGTIITSGLSKWCGAGGWRLGYMAIPNELSWLLGPLDAIASETFSAVAAPIQHASVRAFAINDPDIDEYLNKQRKILGYVAKYCAKHLKKAGVRGLEGKGGFYMMPNFQAFSSSLRLSSIFTSEDLCDKLLADTGVCLLPGTSFLRPKRELSARLAFVCFDGQHALDNIGAYNKKKSFETFVEKHCPDVAEGIQLIADWTAKAT